MRRIPVISILFSVTDEAKKEAFVKLLLNTIFSTLPIWLVALLTSLRRFQVSENNYAYDLWQSFFQTISNGELFMYTVALMGPLIYVGFQYNWEKNSLRNIRTLFSIAILLTLIATGLFVDSRGYDESNLGLLKSISILCYFISLLILYIVYSLESSFGSIREAAASEEESFLDGYSKHRGAQE